MCKKALTFLLMIGVFIGLFSGLAFGERNHQEIMQKAEEIRNLNEKGTIELIPGCIIVRIADGILLFPRENPGTTKRTPCVTMPLDSMIINYQPLDSIFKIIEVNSVRGYLRRPGDTVKVSRLGDTLDPEVVKPGLQRFRIMFSDTIDVLYAMELFLSLPDSIVIYAEPNARIEAPRDIIIPHKPNVPDKGTKSIEPNDPYYSSQWALPKIKCPDAWEISKGDGILIAIIDQGVDSDHEDLKDKVIMEPWPGETGYDTPHGTAMAGVAAAVTNNGKGIAGVP